MRKVKQCWQDNTFDIVVLVILTIMLLLSLYPLYYVLIASVSDVDAINNGKVLLYPIGINLESYKTVLKDPRIITGYGNTIFYTVVGTAVSVIITVLAAFPLSRNDMLGLKFITWIFLFTMYFSGGLIPTYMVVKSLNLVDTRTIMVLNGCLSIYNVIICRTYFKSNIPNELWEVASIDGCSMYRFIFAIVIPLSKAVIAIMVLYYAVAQWNEFFKALIYLNDSSKYPLQLLLRDILLSNSSMLTDADPELLEKITQQAETMKYAVIVVSSLPVLAIYPFIQKYFVKGIMVGAVKG